MTMKKMIALVLLAAASGCYTVNAQLPGALRNDKPEVEKVGQVNIEKTNYFFILGLVGEPPPDFFAAELKKQVEAKGGDGVANLQYESSSGCVDLIISECTFQIVTPRDYKLTGDIVRIKSAPLPGKTSAKTVSAPTPDKPSTVAQGY
jgi:hypothetical protein